MGIGTWALLALVAIITVYLLPVLVGRREVLGHSRVEDRYSQRMRLLATEEECRVPGEACDEGGHAQIFRRRPEVRAMNRPAVRNVRAVRAERELARARQAHAQGRERRKQAAAHRAIVACALLGVFLGFILVSLLTELPAWLSVIPAGLLALSVAAGRRAAVAAAESDRRERRRIADCERELALVTGKIAPVAHDTAAALAEAAETTPSLEAREQESFADADLHQEAPAIDEQQERSEHEASSAASASTDAPVTAMPAHAHQDEVSEQAVTVSDGEDRQLAPAADKPAVAAQTVAAASEIMREEVSSQSVSHQPVMQQAKPPVPSTPPQGWRPVHVPAPTYTMVGSAPKRALVELEEAVAPSAPVPHRPTAVRTYSADVDVRTPAQPIDLDAVLQRRRAAGA